jgi:hypothetical protein
MLSVRWNEDKEGCLVATWCDDENAGRGGFVETLPPMDDWCEEEISLCGV